MAYICICNQISEEDIEEDPELIKECGTGCGSCLEYVKEKYNVKEDNKQED